MREEKRFTRATFRIMEQLLESENLEDALAGGLEIIVETLQSEAGVIWILDPKTDRLHTLCHVGEADLSNITVENGQGPEGLVTQTGQSLVTADAAGDRQAEGSALEDNGMTIKTMICVPLNDLKNTIGCLQVVNKKDGGAYDEQERKLCEQMASLAAFTIEEKGLQTELGEEKEVLVALRNVTKEFPSGDGVLQVLKGINLEIYKNEFVILLGESGCGKSTMMNIVGGMDSLTDGELLIEGKSFSHPTEEELTQYRREYIGFIFQAYNLMPNLTALENVQFIAELVADPMPAEDAIARVKLSDRANNYPGQMSGGQQQRVSIARAIVKKPRLILADEPTAALDYTTSVEVLSVIEDIVKNQGTTVMMVTHNAEIARMADRVVKMRGGKIASVKKNVHPLHAHELVW